jgi:glutaminase
VGTIAEPTPTHSANGGRPSDLASPMASYLARLHARYPGLAEGEVATHIPELAKGDPGWFGILHGGEWRGSPDLSPPQPRTR